MKTVQVHLTNGRSYPRRVDGSILDCLRLALTEFGLLNIESIAVSDEEETHTFPSDSIRRILAPVPTWRRFPVVSDWLTRHNRTEEPSSF